MDILTEIVGRTYQIIAERAATRSLAELTATLAAHPREELSLTARLAENQPNIIAEFKRKSPSRPNINKEADPVAVAHAYETGGAAAMSILTEPDYFSGSPDDLTRVRKTAGMPLLRKDFMVDTYQFYEAAVMGADLVLLIARILEPEQLAEFTDLAHHLGLEVLCEIHDEEELEIVGDAPVDFLGVNCRDLKKFETNLDHLVAMAKVLPGDIPWVAESGIHGPDDVKRLYQSGYQCFLVGEHLMKSEDPAAAVRGLIDCV